MALTGSMGPSVPCIGGSLLRSSTGASDDQNLPVGHSPTLATVVRPDVWSSDTPGWEWVGL
jgi:hypothetical protein